MGAIYIILIIYICITLSQMSHMVHNLLFGNGCRLLDSKVTGDSDQTYGILANNV